jgi:hypothetical protein
MNEMVLLPRCSFDELLQLYVEYSVRPILHSFNP